MFNEIKEKYQHLEASMISNINDMQGYRVRKKIKQELKDTYLLNKREVRGVFTQNITLVN